MSIETRFRLLLAGAIAFSSVAINDVHASQSVESDKPTSFEPVDNPRESVTTNTDWQFGFRVGCGFFALNEYLIYGPVLTFNDDISLPGERAVIRISEPRANSYYLLRYEDGRIFDASPGNWGDNAKSVLLKDNEQFRIRVSTSVRVGDFMLDETLVDDMFVAPDCATIERPIRST